MNDKNDAIALNSADSMLPECVFIRGIDFSAGCSLTSNAREKISTCTHRAIIQLYVSHRLPSWRRPFRSNSINRRWALPRLWNNSCIPEVSTSTTRRHRESRPSIWRLVIGEMSDQSTPRCIPIDASVHVGTRTRRRPLSTSLIISIPSRFACRAN